MGMKKIEYSVVQWSAPSPAGVSWGVAGSSRGFASLGFMQVNQV